MVVPLNSDVIIQARFSGRSEIVRVRLLFFQPESRIVVPSLEEPLRFFDSVNFDIRLVVNCHS